MPSFIRQSKLCKDGQFPVYLILRFIAKGLKFTQILVRPKDGFLEWAKGTIERPKGKPRSHNFEHRARKATMVFAQRDFLLGNIIFLSIITNGSAGPSDNI